MPAVIVHINSPGGTTAGSEQLHDALLRLKAQKPLVVVVDGLAASGGYIAAIAADHIIAQETSLVGSIGVMFQYPNVGDLLKTLGIKVEEVKSSPLKAAPSGYRADLAGGARRDRSRRPGFLCLVPRSGEEPPAARRCGIGAGGRRPRVHRPAGAGAQARRRARRREGRHRLAGEGKERRSQDRRCAIIGCATGSATCRSCTRRGHACSTPPVSARSRGGIEEWGTLQALERLNLDGLLALWHPPPSN